MRFPTDTNDSEAFDLAVGSYGGVLPWPSVPTWSDIKTWAGRKLVRLGLAIVPERHTVSYARTELELAGFLAKDGIYDGMIGEAVIATAKIFELEGHSGMSASIAVGLFGKVAMYQPLTPLTDEPDQWNEVADNFFQHRRCGRVFKRADGTAYDIEGKVFMDEEDGPAWYTSSRRSRTPITFPYTPTTAYFIVKADGSEIPHQA